MSVGETELSDAPLTVADHTRVMQAITDRSINLVMHLRDMGVVEKGTKPTPEQAIEAALRIRSLDAETRSSLERVRALYPEIKAEEEKLPPATVKAVDDLKSELENKPIDEQLSLLGRLRTEPDASLLPASALTMAEQILEDGADTIYAPEHPLAELEGSNVLGSFLAVAGADAAGGALGTITPIPGAGPVEAVGASIAELADLIISWF